MPNDFEKPKNDAPLGRIPVSRVIDKIDSLFEKNNYEEAGRLLCYWRDEAAALRDREGELAVVNELVGFYRKQNDKEKGLAAVSRALSLAQELEQTEMASGATVLINCATAYKAFGMAEESMPLYRRAEEIYTKALSSKDTRMGALYNNMALALVDIGDIEGAKRAYLSALEVMESYPDTKGEAAITYINLAHMYESRENIEKIRECMEKAFELLKAPELIHNGYYAFILEKCAPSFEYFGYTDIAKELKGEARSIYERS